MNKVIVDEKKIDEVLSRGVEETFIKDDLRKNLLSGKQLRVKLGIDPTGPRIHLGRAIPLRKLKAFQDLGHKAVLIVGDFTAQIGDASDKLSKRPMLTEAQIKENLKNYKKTLGKIVDLKKAEFKFNSSWLKKLTFREVALLAETFSVQQMVARRNFKERWDKGEEISLREFMYPLMQGYDSVAVKSDLELGGFDQLFNLKAGRVIQKHYKMKEQDIMTLKMLEGLDGRKMSTSWGNVVNIDDEPNDMFGKIMSLNDELMENYLVLCTNLEISKIKEILSMSPRDAKIVLAEEVVSVYYGRKIGEEAKNNFVKVFTEKKNPENIEVRSFGKESLSLLDLVFESGLVSSKSEIKRLIEQGGVKVDEVKKTDSKEIIKLDKEIVLQVGPRRFMRIKK